MGSLSGSRQYLVQQDQHNVLSLSTGGRTRFTLLPVGSTSNKNFSEQDVLDTTTKVEPKPKVLLLVVVNVLVMHKC